VYDTGSRERVPLTGPVMVRPRKRAYEAIAHEAWRRRPAGTSAYICGKTPSATRTIGRSSKKWVMITNTTLRRHR
jgi:hypothetical protein